MISFKTAKEPKLKSFDFRAFHFTSRLNKINAIFMNVLQSLYLEFPVLKHQKSIWRRGSKKVRTKSALIKRWCQLYSWVTRFRPNEFWKIKRWTWDEQMTRESGSSSSRFWSGLKWNIRKRFVKHDFDRMVRFLKLGLESALQSQVHLFTFENFALLEVLI